MALGVASKLPAAFPTPKLNRSFHVYHISCYWMTIQVDPTSSYLASVTLNSKIRPRAVVGYSVKIFHPSPPNYITRSPRICLSLRTWHTYTTAIVFFSLFYKFGYNFISSQEGPQVLEEVQCFSYQSWVVMWPLEEGTKLSLIMWQQNARKLEKMLRWLHPFLSLKGTKLCPAN